MQIRAPQALSLPQLAGLRTEHETTSWQRVRIMRLRRVPQTLLQSDVQSQVRCAALGSDCLSG